MVRRLLFLSVFVSVFLSTAASKAESCVAQTCTPGVSEIKPSNCNIMTSGSQYNGVCIYSCGTCKDGYVKFETTETQSGCSISYTDCKEESRTPGGEVGGDFDIISCLKDSQCTDGTGTQVITGGTSTTTGKCSNGVCLYEVEVSCNEGYYNNYRRSCVRCPNVNGVYGTSPSGSSGVTSCYMPAGTVVSDSTGVYEYVATCEYN